MNDAPTHTEAFQAFAATRSGRFAQTGGPERLVNRATRLAREGDNSALRYLYVRYADDVYRYVQSIVHDSHEAEDITQNVFARLRSALQTYEERAVPFSAWMLRVARNAALDHLRAPRMVPCEEVRTSDEGHEQIGFERCECLKCALDQLPEAQREVLVLRQIIGLSPAEVARRLGKTEGAIHGLHHRGRCALRKALRELGAAPATVAA